MYLSNLYFQKFFRGPVFDLPVRHLETHDIDTCIHSLGKVETTNI